MKYRVAVGERIFAELQEKEKAIDLAKCCSGVYQGKICRLVTQKWTTVKGTPEFMNGKEI